MKQSTLLLVIGAVAVVGVIAVSAMNMQNSSLNTSISGSSPEAVVMETDQNAKTQTIVEVATQAGNFTTLVAAVKAAGLAETLSAEGPFTVFAPTDEAFAKLPAGTVESLLQNKEKLTQILTYHVVAGNVMAKDVAGMTSAQTVEGSELMVKVVNGKVMIDNATVTTADIEASNGIIHVIDTVLIPQ